MGDGAENKVKLLPSGCPQASEGEMTLKLRTPVSTNSICEPHREQLRKGSKKRRDRSSHKLYLLTFAKEIRKAGTLQSWRVSPGGESTRTQGLAYPTNAPECGSLDGSKMAERLEGPETPGSLSTPAGWGRSRRNEIH